MAKVSFNKLNKIKNLPSKKTLLNGVEIEVEQYLPLSKKLELMGSIIEQAGNEQEGFFNIVKLDAYYKIEMLKHYTNINFTEKNTEDIPKLIDAIELNGIWIAIENEIPQQEREYIWTNVIALAKQITEYNHSALGLFESLSNLIDLKANQEEIDTLVEEAEHLKELPIIKDILPLMQQ